MIVTDQKLETGNKNYSMFGLGRIMVDQEPVSVKEALEKAMRDAQDTMAPVTLLEPQQSLGSSTRALSLWRASQITDRHREFKPEESNSSEWNAQWCKLSQALGKGTLAVIIGNRGAGKSQMAVCAIRQACKDGNPSLYTKALNFFLDVRMSYRKDAKYSEKEVIDKYCEPYLLVIDAIENRSDSQFENLLLNHLIDIRYDQCKDTVLIGNYNEQEFAASMGPSIVDRIHECGIKIICGWKSFRRK
jgi:DNA replication protein DnaC